MPNYKDFDLDIQNNKDISKKENDNEVIKNDLPDIRYTGTIKNCCY